MGSHGGTQQIGVRDAVTMMVRGNLGPGMLALPYAFGQAGWLAGAVVMVLNILQGMYSMQVLVTCERLLVADLAAKNDEDAEEGAEMDASDARRAKPTAKTTAEASTDEEEDINAELGTGGVAADAELDNMKDAAEKQITTGILKPFAKLVISACHHPSFNAADPTLK